MARIWQDFIAAFMPPTYAERYRDALDTIEELTDECGILRFERAIAVHDRNTCLARAAELEAGVGELLTENEQLKTERDSLLAALKAAGRPALETILES